MKKQNNLAHTILRGIIVVLTIILAGLLVPKGYELWKNNQKKEEWQARNKEVVVEIDHMRGQIEALSGDNQALQNFLIKELELITEETTAIGQHMEITQDGETEEVPLDTAEVEVDRPVSNKIEDGVEATVGDAIIVTEAPAYVAPEQEKPLQEEKTLKERQEDVLNTVSQNTADMASYLESENQKMADSISENAAKSRAAEEEKAAEQKRLAEEAAATISENAAKSKAQASAQEDISGNAVVDGKVIPFQEEDGAPTLEARRALLSSYEETLRENEKDKVDLAQKDIDFSSIKIACIGDSLTAATNLDKMDDYIQYSYPSVLKEVLQASEVYNLGIGGSSYGRYWDTPFVERYKDIPQDTNVILVMGGANDGFAASVEELGNLQERKKSTFYGDVNELMLGLKKEYPQALVVFVTPLPNVLHDYLMSQRQYLLPQLYFVNAIKELAAEHEIKVIDLYNSNILDTHDARVISELMPDGVHGNPKGYRIMAEYIGSELIHIMEGAQNSESGNSISGNLLEENKVPEVVS